MKNRLILSALLILSLFMASAQEMMYIHKTDKSVLQINIAEIDSLAFGNNNQNFYIYKSDKTFADLLVSQIDSLTFVEETVYADAIRISYSENAVDIINPYENAGVAISHDGANVVVNSSGTNTELTYVLSGATSNGSFKIYSDYKFELAMNGVDITSVSGPAINIQSGKKVSITLVENTNNKLIDSPNYDETAAEDMKSALFSEGQLIIDGTGTLIVQGNYKHAICSDDYIYFKGGNTIITGAVKDGIHCNDYFKMDGGALNVTALSDGIECEEGYVQINNGSITVNSGDDAITASYKKTGAIVSTVEITGGRINIVTNNQKGAGIKSKISSIIISGGILDVSVLGVASKALNAGGDLTITGGEINLKTSGNAYYDSDEADTSSAAGIKCDGDFLFENGVLGITSSGSGGKGINVDGALTINNGTITVTTTGAQYVYDRNNDTAAKAIKSTRNLIVNGGDITIKTSKTEAEGLESKANLTINGGKVEIEAYDDCINASNHIEITGGIVYCLSTTNDAIDSNGTFTMSGGTVIAIGASSPEGGIDCDNNTLKITGGTLIGIGGSTSTPTTNACTQRALIYGENSFSIIHIESSTGSDILTFKLPKTFSKTVMLFSSPSMVANTTYAIYTGGSISDGVSTYGLFTGATYTKGTSAGNFTTSSMVTTVGSTGGNPGGGGGPGGRP